MNDRAAPLVQRIEGHAAIVGDGMPINRVLPSRWRRLVGPWCFMDHIGPADIASSGELRVGPHPHIGLQTVTWLIEGEILHRDSLSSLQLIRAGQLNVMTSGRAICHSEESPRPTPAHIHGVQLWTVLPESARHGEPLFDHYPTLPQISHQGLQIKLMSGEAFGQRSPARHYWPIVGMEIHAPTALDATLPLNPNFEHAVLVLGGQAQIGDELLAPDTLLFFGPGHEQLALHTDAECRLMLIGGAPFTEEILMWWNFVGRTREEITEACQQWNAGEGEFGEVRGYDGARLIAPMPPWAK